jgi:hypothetical protein
MCVVGMIWISLWSRTDDGRFELALLAGIIVIVYYSCCDDGGSSNIVDIIIFINLVCAMSVCKSKLSQEPGVGLC